MKNPDRLCVIENHGDLIWRASNSCMLWRICCVVHRLGLAPVMRDENMCSFVLLLALCMLCAAALSASASDKTRKLHLTELSDIFCADNLPRARNWFQSALLARRNSILISENATSNVRISYYPLKLIFFGNPQITFFNKLTFLTLYNFFIFEIINNFDFQWETFYYLETNSFLSFFWQVFSLLFTQSWKFDLKMERNFLLLKNKFMFVIVWMTFFSLFTQSWKYDMKMRLENKVAL